MCATDDSYQKARQSMAQAEEETRSRSAIVIKAGGRYLGEQGVGGTVTGPSREEGQLWWPGPRRLHATVSGQRLLGARGLRPG